MVFLEQFNHFLLFLKIVPANVFVFFLRLIFQYLGVIVDRCSPVQEQTQTSAVSAASERWRTRQWAACGLCALTIWPHCFISAGTEELASRGHAYYDKVNCEIEKNDFIYKKDRSFSNQTSAYIRQPAFLHPSASISCQSIKERLPSQLKDSCQNFACSDGASSGQ